MALPVIPCFHAPTGCLFLARRSEGGGFFKGLVEIKRCPALGGFSLLLRFYFMLLDSSVCFLLMVLFLCFTLLLLSAFLAVCFLLFACCCLFLVFAFLSVNFWRDSVPLHLHCFLLHFCLVSCRLLFFLTVSLVVRRAVGRTISPVVGQLSPHSSNPKALTYQSFFW